MLIVSFCPGQGRLWPDCRVGWAGLPRGPGFLGWSGRETFDLFTEREVVVLLMAIATINVWNRLAVSTHQLLPGIDET